MIYYEKKVARLFPGWKVSSEDPCKGVLILEKSGESVKLEGLMEAAAEFEATKVDLKCDGDTRYADRGEANVTVYITLHGVPFPKQPE